MKKIIWILTSVSLFLGLMSLYPLEIVHRISSAISLYCIGFSIMLLAIEKGDMMPMPPKPEKPQIENIGALFKRQPIVKDTLQEETKQEEPRPRIKTKKQNEFKCSLCSESFESAEELKKHIGFLHWEEIDL